MDPKLAIGAGFIDGLRTFSKFGFKQLIPADIEVVVWPGANIYNFPSDTGDNLEMLSTGAGAAADNQLIEITYLDVDFLEQKVLKQLTGTTPVPLPGLITRINRAANADDTKFAGTVHIRNVAVPANVYAILLPSEQITTQMIYTVPAQEKAVVENPTMTYNDAGQPDSAVVMKLNVRRFGGIFMSGPRFGLQKRGSSAIVIDMIGEEHLPPKTDLYVTAMASDPNTDVSVRMPFTLYKV